MSSPARLLEGKSAIVTGGASGIGAAVTRAFSASGAHVFILDRDADSGRALAAELASDGRSELAFLAYDAAQPREIEAAIDEVVRLSGRIDCLVNNVGVHPPPRAIDDVSVESFEDVLRINLTSCFAASKHALPHLRRVAGSIVNIGSLVSRIGQELSPAYVAAKGGVAALTRALAIDESRHGVRVNAVLPGVIGTPSHAAFVGSTPDPEATDIQVSSWQWLRRIGHPDDVAGVCLFLASDLATFVTGAELVVSGGAELGYATKVPVAPDLAATSSILVARRPEGKPLRG